jgi:hypothetical protein
LWVIGMLMGRWLPKRKRTKKPTPKNRLQLRRRNVPSAPQPNPPQRNRLSPPLTASASRLAPRRPPNHRPRSST